MFLTTLPQNVIDDLVRFVHEQYTEKLPNSLLIAQAFILEYPEYGRAYGLPAVNHAIEEGIKNGLFKRLWIMAPNVDLIEASHEVLGINVLACCC